MFAGGDAETKAAVRIHLFTLLFEDCKLLCAKIVQETQILTSMTRLLHVTQQKLKQYQQQVFENIFLHLSCLNHEQEIWN